ncbi:AbrB/MazE/SpoVT family DNA-binding domain-containing protein [Paracidovorax citrulli]
MHVSTTLSSDFRISIPKALREERQWRAGQKFVLRRHGAGVLLMPVTELHQVSGVARDARKGHDGDRQDRY